MNTKKVLSLMDFDRPTRHEKNHATAISRIYHFFESELKNIISVEVSDDNILFGYKTSEMAAKKITVITGRGQYCIAVPFKSPGLFLEFCSLLGIQSHLLLYNMPEIINDASKNKPMEKVKPKKAKEEKTSQKVQVSDTKKVDTPVTLIEKPGGEIDIVAPWVVSVRKLNKVLENVTKTYDKMTFTVALSMPDLQSLLTENKIKFGVTSEA